MVGCEGLMTISQLKMEASGKPPSPHAGQRAGEGTYTLPRDVARIFGLGGQILADV